jgi:hypothetical protein
MSNNFVVGDFVACGGCGCNVSIDAAGKMCLQAGGGGGGIIVAGTGTNSTIRCGVNNTAAGNAAVSLGGCNNIACGNCSFVGGGACNTASNYYFAFVGGGQCNTASGYFSFIGGGSINTAYGYKFSTVGNGCCNISGGFASTISNGICNTATGSNTFIGSGQCNLACGNESFIGGGVYNIAGSGGSFIGNGFCNNAGGSLSFIGNGCYNVNCGSRSFMGNGFENNITVNSNCSAILSGGKNCNDSCYSTISGGYSNTISGFGSFIGSGTNNVACGCLSFIGGGQFNTACGAYSGAFGCGLEASAACTFYVNNMCVCGTLSKASGSFKIPHPDPIKAEAGKFLKHSFVESPTAGDNIYRFNVTTSNCSASIELPDYYSLLNTNDQVYVNAKKHLGYGFGIVNDEQTRVDITTNTDGEYNVLLIGTRKDKLALDAWNGTEVNDVE